MRRGWGLEGLGIPLDDQDLFLLQHFLEPLFEL
jgi:hypothetical protein